MSLRNRNAVPAIRHAAWRKGRAALLLFALAVLPAIAQEAPQLSGGIANMGTLGPQELYLDVEVNGQPAGLIAHFVRRDGRLFAEAGDLEDLGIATDELGLASDALVALDDIPGLRYRYDAAAQRVVLTVPDALRIPYRLDARQLEPIPAATASPGLLVNYEAYGQYDTEARLSLWNEARYFNAHGVFSTTGVAYLDRERREYLRFDTSWRHSDEMSLTTTQLGDLVSSSMEWSRSLRMAGVQFRKNFDLRPDLVTFPVPVIGATAVMPSSIDLYVNNVRRSRGEVPSGPFVINDIPGITGAGSATVVTRDALGRDVTTTVPLYVDRRLLAQGLSAYSVEAGFLRRRYGAASFDYGRRPAASGSLRYGATDWLTLETHAEAAQGLANAGAGALVRLGTAGVVSASMSRSAGEFAGTQASLGYQWIHPQLSFDWQSVRTVGNYGDLASREGVPVPNAIDRVTVTKPILERQSVSLSYIRFAMPGADESRIASAAYSMGMGNRVSLNLSAYQDLRERSVRGVFLGLSIGFGDVSYAANVNRQNGQAGYAAEAMRPAPYGGGWGWAARTGRTAQLDYHQAQAQFLGTRGELIGVAQRVGPDTSASLNASGALVAMDGSVHLARRIYDGFALVSTDGIGNVPVMHENRPIGRTDDSGHLLVPDLNAYQHNRISIDPLGLPAALRVPDTRRDVVPQAQSGVLARFAIERQAAATLVLHDEGGRPLRVGASVIDARTEARTVVGYDGMAFVSGLQDRNRLEVEWTKGRCSVDFAFTPPSDGSLTTLGPLVCRSNKKDDL